MIMNTKIFWIIKTGYSKWVYWCTGEYFTAFYTKIEEYKWVKSLKIDSFHFEGMYWVEERVKSEFEKLGFEYNYINWNFWKLTKKDIYKNTKNEEEAIEYIKNNIK